VGDKVLDSKITHRSLGAIHSKANQLGLTKEPTGRKISMPDDKKKQGSVPANIPSIDIDSLMLNLGSNGDHKNKHYRRFYKLFHKKLAEKHGIELDDIGKALGKGTMGVAFEYKNGVIKATKDMTEAFSSSAIKGKEVPGVVDIYRVVMFSWSDSINYRFDSHGAFADKFEGGFHFAFIVQEKLQPLSPKLKIKLQKRLKKFSKHMGDKLAFFLRDYSRKRISRKSLQKIFMKLWKEPGLYPGFWNAIDNLSRNGITFYDFHMGNLLADSAGKIKILDLGYSYTENKKGLETVSLMEILRRMDLIKG